MLQKDSQFHRDPVPTSRAAIRPTSPNQVRMAPPIAATWHFGSVVMVSTFAVHDAARSGLTW